MPPTGTEASGTQHVQVCDGSALPNADDSKVYAIRTNGALSYEVLDVTDPAKPQFLRTIAETGVSSRPESERGSSETHKFQWECATGHRVSERHGARLARHARAAGVRFERPGRAKTRSRLRARGLRADVDRAVPRAAGRGAPSAVRRRQSHVLGLQQRRGGHAADRRSRRVPDAATPTPTAENLRAPEIARLDLPSYWGVHTAKPIYDFEIADYADNRDARTRDLLLVASEAGTFRCQEPRDVLLIFDITEEEHTAADCDVPSARGARRLLPSRRAVRPALVRRRLSPGVRPRSSSCSRTSTPAFASSISAIRSSRRKSRASFPR